MSPWERALQDQETGLKLLGKNSSWRPTERSFSHLRKVRGRLVREVERPLVGSRLNIPPVHLASLVPHWAAQLCA